MAASSWCHRLAGATREAHLRWSSRPPAVVTAAQSDSPRPAERSCTSDLVCRGTGSTVLAAIDLRRLADAAARLPTGAVAPPGVPQPASNSDQVLLPPRLETLRIRFPTSSSRLAFLRDFVVPPQRRWILKPSRCEMVDAPIDAADIRCREKMPPTCAFLVGLHNADPEDDA
jgi:hypothetical protein